jgi:hypothetical protein
MAQKHFRLFKNTNDSLLLNLMFIAVAPDPVMSNQQLSCGLRSLLQPAADADNFAKTEATPDGFSMAMARLFGKSAKKAPVPPSQSDHCLDQAASAVVGEDEGFTVLAHSKSDTNTQDAKAVFNGYPALPQDIGGGYPAVPGGKHRQGGDAGGVAPVAHALDGVPFTLAEQYVSNGDRNHLDASLQNILDQLEGAGAVLRDSEYDFRLEKHVIESDVTATIKRLHVQ